MLAGDRLDLPQKLSAIAVYSVGSRRYMYSIHLAGRFLNIQCHTDLTYIIIVSKDDLRGVHSQFDIASSAGAIRVSSIVWTYSIEIVILAFHFGCWMDSMLYIYRRSCRFFLFPLNNLPDNLFRGALPRRLHPFWDSGWQLSRLSSHPHSIRHSVADQKEDRGGRQWRHYGPLFADRLLSHLCVTVRCVPIYRPLNFT